MPLFRKRPVTIEARRVPIWGETNDGREFSSVVFVDDAVALAEWCGGRSYLMFPPDGQAEGIVIATLEGEMLAAPGDMVIKGVAGEFYPCKPDIFAATYEPAEEPATTT